MTHRSVASGEPAQEAREPVGSAYELLMLLVSVAGYADHRPDCPAHTGSDCTCGFEQAKAAFTAATPDWVEGDPPRVYETKTRVWYEDRAGRRYRADELVAWGSPAVDAVLQAAAKAEGLPPLTRPSPRRVSPRRS